MRTRFNSWIDSVLTLLLVGAGQIVAGQTPSKLDTAAIEKALGKAGVMMPGDVYRVAFPRTDLDVTSNGVKLRPGFALGGWAAFRAADGGAVLHGDLVLTESEINPMISKLEQAGIEIIALHNHVLGETPRVMYLHYWGRGDAAKLASSLKNALTVTKTPFTAPPAPAAAPSSTPEFDRIQQILGVKGSVTGGVLAIGVPRPERILMMGVELPPSMGMATAMNFQESTTGKVAATGDFVLLASEVNNVVRALRDHGIEITSLHNHMMNGTPVLYFMHFWVNDTPDKVSAGLKAGLEAMQRSSSAH